MCKMLFSLRFFLLNIFDDPNKKSGHPQTTFRTHSGMVPEKDRKKTGFRPDLDRDLLGFGPRLRTFLNPFLIWDCKAGKKTLDLTDLTKNYLFGRRSAFSIRSELMLQGKT